MNFYKFFSSLSIDETGRTRNILVYTDKVPFFTW